MAAKQTNSGTDKKSSRGPAMTVRVSKQAKQNLMDYCLQAGVDRGHRVGLNQGMEEILMNLKPAKRRATGS
jgi:hypothetical protein